MHFASYIVRILIFSLRYLTKITDQIVALISDAHIAEIQWSDQSLDVPLNVDDNEIDRLFSFEVEKTNEQEEQASIRAGFTVNLFGQIVCIFI